MSLEQWSSLSQVIGSVGVILSLLFVGMQIRQNTIALQRSEHNSTMSEWTVIRMAIAGDRDMAELMTTGLHSASALDAASQLRLDHMLAEYAWASFHVWDRTKRGVFPPGTFEATAGPLLAGVLDTARGKEWWQRAKSTGYFPAFVAAVDAFLASRGSGKAG